MHILSVRYILYSIIMVHSFSAQASNFLEKLCGINREDEPKIEVKRVISALDIQNYSSAKPVYRNGDIPEITITFFIHGTRAWPQNSLRDVFFVPTGIYFRSDNPDLGIFRNVLFVTTGFISLPDSCAFPPPCSDISLEELIAQCQNPPICNQPEPVPDCNYTVSYPRPGQEPAGKNDPFRVNVLNERSLQADIAKILRQVDPARFDFHSPCTPFYFLGWDGALDSRQREFVSEAFYSGIGELLQQWKIHIGITPKVRIITHSHGGNLVLNFPVVKQKVPQVLHFVVDELIMLACPVQDVNKFNVRDASTFKKVTTFFSPTDFIQVFDPQQLFLGYNNKGKKYFSERLFPESPDNQLIQVYTKIVRGSLQHNDFTRAKFLRVLPRLLDEVEALRLAAPNTSFLAVLEILGDLNFT